ncbi:MAG: hypothetical protein ACK5TI_01145 [bacterium]|nr:hypothetical protein [Betaproteobacteria bacterium]
MRHIIDTGCDGAAVCAFDPAALPLDADERLLDDPMDSMQAWQAERRFWVGGTGGDGRYIFHVHVNEPLPEPEPGSIHTLDAQFERFSCPSGVLWFCGAEYAARDPVAGSEATPTGGLGRYSTQGGRVSLPPGEHAISIYRVERPEADDAAALRQLARDARSIDLRVVASMLLWLTGGLAIGLAAFVLVVSLPVKLFQWASGSPLFREGWHVYPITMAVLIAGFAAIGAGRWFDVRYRRSARGMEDDIQELERADYVVSVTLRAPE